MPIPELLRNYAMQLGFPNSETLARIFQVLFDHEDDLQVVQALPGTPAELAERTGLSIERVREIGGKLRSRGAVGHPLGQPELLCRFPAMIELRDSTVLWPDAPQEIFELWDRLVMVETRELIPLLKSLDVPAMVRVIPVESKVEAQNTVLDADSARRIFKDAELVSVVPCACRLVARKNGRGKDCPAPADSVCLQTNAFAEGVLSRGLGLKITNAEALRRIGAAEDAGLVHMIRNNIKKDMFMCNCCSCCCSGLHFVNQLGYLAGIAPSRFRIKLDQDACSGCGACEDRCQFHAIRVDQVASINLERCYGCGNCALACPEEALVLEEIRPLSHIRVK
ncbi:MAG: 4Fe-4S binding protein [Proteobacteria bacterium]|nr:4Fe-4S binding protein [Pseudomonadota bacterium]